MSGVDLKAITAQVRSSGNFRPLVEAIPFARFLRLEVARDAEGLLTTMRFAPHQVGNSLIPALHGGTLGALLESAAIFSLLWEVPAENAPKTINVTVQFLRTARTADTFARAEIFKQGRRVATVRAQCWQDSPDKPVASATAQFLLTPREVTAP